jgi:glyoxylase-like metal-dependent hydrolase (beta-lactamase superfamily II)
MEIVRGVHQIKVPISQGSQHHINVYVLEGDEGNLMVDTSWNTPESFNALKDGLKEKGFGFKDIKQIVITHAHPDHYGLAGRLKQLGGAKLYMHEAEAKLIDSRYVDIDELMKEMGTLLKRHGVPLRELPNMETASLGAKELVVPTMPDQLLRGGEHLSTGEFELEVIHTPGHSIGHICLYEPQRKLLFSGDHVLPDITPVVGLHAQSGANPLGDFINSLKEVEKLEVNFVLPGHGAAFSGLKQKVWDILYHHEQRLREITTAIRDDLKTAYQIAKEVTWAPQEGGVDFDKLGPFDKRLALMETLAHLELLIAEGKAEKIIEDDKILFWAGG